MTRIAGRTRSAVGGWLKIGLVAALGLGAAAVGAAERERGTMYVDGRFLYTAAGEKVVLRGVNEMMVWSDDPTGEFIYPQIAKSGANVLRLVWTTEGDLETLEQSFENSLNQGMIPMVELHDATGKMELVPKMVDWWVRPEVVELIERHKKWFILNIANEPGTDDVTRSEFVETYREAIDRIRGAGIKVPLVIDASDWGKDEEMILDTWRELRDHDPLKSVMFSVHTYWVEDQQERLDHLMEQVVEQEIPFLFGEGPQAYGYDCESEFPWRDLIRQGQEKQVGWIAWSWGYQNNGDCPGRFDMTTDGVYGNWENEWGEGLVETDPNSIRNTSIRPDSLKAEMGR